ncbi:MAG: WbqC family protein [Terriglobales bacterium]
MNIETSDTTAAGDRRQLLLSGHQPVYLPGIVLFNKIALSDVFMFAGHCQYSKKSWHSRNRIRLADHELWLSIPVKTAGRFDQAINATYMVNDLWKRKHSGSIRQAYLKSPFFHTYYPELEHHLRTHSGSLGDLNISLVKLILRWLDIRTPIIDSRDYNIRETSTGMLISMCQAIGAGRYLSNEGSRAYVDEQQMAEAGIEHFWQIFEHPIYPQPATPFMPNLSVIDLLFNVGPEAREVVLSCGKIVRGKCVPTRTGAE